MHKKVNYKIDRPMVKPKRIKCPEPAFAPKAETHVRDYELGKEVARLIRQGYTIKEIADKIAKHPSTVRRWHQAYLKQKGYGK